MVKQVGNFTILPTDASHADKTHQDGTKYAVHITDKHVEIILRGK